MSPSKVDFCDQGTFFYYSDKFQTQKNSRQDFSNTTFSVEAVQSFHWLRQDEAIVTLESTASSKVIDVDDLETNYAKEMFESLHIKDTSCQLLPPQLNDTGCHFAEKLQQLRPHRERMQLRKRGRPLVKPTAMGKKARPIKVWEFLIDLLKDPQYNPKILYWLNRKEGLFRFAQSKRVAQLWALRRNKKESLSYEHFSRTMRYHYKREYLKSVPNERLTYQFGPKAMNNFNRQKM